MHQAKSRLLNLWRSLLGALIFYTICPIPSHWQPSFNRIARWSPFIGVMLGFALSGVFFGLSLLNTPNLLKSVILVSLWLALTGGLHLDGAMDSADGLAVTDPERRIEVMKDSTTGAFGAMSAMVILALKVAAVSAFSIDQWWVLPLTLGWGRWSQVTAIAFYPYLKQKGKGAFHTQDFQYPSDLLSSPLPILCIPISQIFSQQSNYLEALLITTAGIITALSVSLWFQAQFKGQTGDTYGAAVEWTESFVLSLAIIILQ
ncbi:MAG: adenosylcobinamide-GDP ribazoletransferase [Limnothrix sp. RL_2_0]|nr:adenosylcobinamide-GDP ribazoletransferase [Limnothrix sp. RL_2_0]